MTTRKASEAVSKLPSGMKLKSLKSSDKTASKSSKSTSQSEKSVLIETAKTIGGALGRVVGTVNKALAAGAKEPVPNEKKSTGRQAPKQEIEQEKLAAKPVKMIGKPVPKQLKEAKK